MRAIWLAVIVGLCGICAGAEETKSVSPTFQDILSRVTQRDKESGAILEVKPKPDAPPLRIGSGLELSFQEGREGNEVEVVLTHRGWKLGDRVYETYRLKTDDAIRQEILNQKRYQERQAELETKRHEGQRKKIAELTHGKLIYGMTPAEVEAVKGKPDHQADAQAVGTFLWDYPDMGLFFTAGRLDDVKLKQK
ncbi:MAG: hypothetical protein AB1696_26830 [Planctomycetota bacterium]